VPPRRVTHLAVLFAAVLAPAAIGVAATPAPVPDATAVPPRQAAVPAAAAPAPAVAVTPAAASTALDRYLDGLSTWAADFTQGVVDSRGRRVGRGSGRLVIVRPGRFRWELAPETAGESGQLLVADGRNLWFLDRDLEQVTVRPQDQGLSQSPAMLLSAAARVRDAFDVVAQGREDGLEWVRVLPRDAAADFRLARFGFRGSELVRLVVEDKLGQRTTLDFRNPRRNAPVDPQLVRFTPPAGADVIGTPVP
jgi:outer membrane lipoprotein carrier protein